MCFCTKSDYFELIIQKSKQSKRKEQQIKIVFQGRLSDVNKREEHQNRLHCAFEKDVL